MSRCQPFTTSDVISKYYPVADTKGPPHLRSMETEKTESATPYNSLSQCDITRVSPGWATSYDSSLPCTHLVLTVIAYFAGISVFGWELSNVRRCGLQWRMVVEGVEGVGRAWDAFGDVWRRQRAMSVQTQVSARGQGAAGEVREFRYPGTHRDPHQPITSSAPSAPPPAPIYP